MIPGIIASFKRFAEVGEELISARYWRLYMDQGRAGNSGSNAYVTVSSVDLLDRTGARIAPSGGTAFASSIYSAAENADKAFDGLSNTVWTTTTTSPTYPHYVGYDFGAGNAVEVAGVSVANRVNYTLGVPLHSWLQWSNDGVEWTNYIELYWGPKDGWGLQARTALSGGTVLAPSEATKWRIAFPVISPAGNQNAVGMSELIMRAAPGGARILPIDYYCSQYDTPAANAFDANNGTQWTTADGIAKPTGGHFLIVTLAEPAAIKQLEMMARQDNYYNEWPTTVVVSYFDGFKWVEYWRREDNTVPPTNGLSRVITMPGVDTGRSKWRFRVNTTQGNGSWVTIPELELRDAYGGADLTKPNGALDGSDPYGTSLKNLINDTTASYQSGRSTYNGPIYFDYDFGRDVTIVELAITAGGTANDSPATGDVLYYDNETSSWVVFWSFVSGTWAAAETKTFNNVAAPPGTSTLAASWSDPGGAGNRTAMIAVSTTMALGAGNISTLVDGLGADNLYFTGGQVGDGTKWIKFDFGAGVKKIIREFNWIAGSNGHGVWAFEGSNDDATWTAIGSTFTLSAGRVWSASHDVGYRYYRLRHMSGTTSSTPWLHEIRFKLVDVSFEENPATSYSNAGGTGDRTSIITVTGTNVGTPTPLVDGSQSNNWWTGNAGSIVFDFGSAKVVDEFIWYQDKALTNGHDSLFTWEGSNDNTTFDMINNHVVLGTELATLCRVPTETAYRYYRLAGDFSTSPYDREIEFKISA